MDGSSDQLALDLIAPRSETTADYPADADSHSPANASSERRAAAEVRSGLEQLLTIDSLADLLHVHRRTVARLVERGELVPIRIGSAVRFHPAEVRRFLDGHQPQAPRRRKARRASLACGGPSVVDRVRSVRP
jgi:excisionase family DNA binding protein